MSEEESVCAVVRYRVRAGSEQPARELLARLAAASAQEPGCLTFTVHRSLEDPQEFLLYERYRDQAALEAHRGSEHFNALAEQGLFALLERREPHLYRRLSDEQPGLGAGER